MRFDVNVSVRPSGTDELRTRTELKNMNSFAFAAKGIEREIARQIKVYESGGTVDQETLHFDPAHEEAPPLRSKEEAQDYRYFPEPDLVPVHPPADVVERLRGEVGELPGARIRRLAETLSFYDADVLVTGGLDRLWSASSTPAPTPKEAANVLANQFVAAGIDPDAVDARELAKLVAARAEIPRAAFDAALAQVGDDGFSADPYLEQKVVSDAGALDPVIERVIAANPGQAEAVPRRQAGPARLLRRPGDEGDAAARPTRASSTSACARSSGRSYGGLGGTPIVSPGRAARPDAASSVASIATAIRRSPASLPRNDQRTAGRRNAIPPIPPR